MVTTTTEVSSEEVSDEALGSLLAGSPPGVYERWDRPLTDVGDLRDRSTVSAVATLVGYELNPPAEGGPNFYVAGYAGPNGVLRLLFRVETIIGGRAPNAVEAPGRPGEGVVAVDTDYWIPDDLQSEHFGGLDQLKGIRFVLFLEGGSVARVSTGTYRFWVPPWGVLAESAGQLSRTWPDVELVERKAVERGQAIEPSSSTTTISAPTTSDYVYRDVLTSLEGMTVASYTSTYQVEDGAHLLPPGPTLVD